MIKLTAGGDDDIYPTGTESFAAGPSGDGRNHQLRPEQQTRPTITVLCTKSRGISRGQWCGEQASERQRITRLHPLEIFKDLITMFQECDARADVLLDDGALVMEATNVVVASGVDAPSRML